MSLKRVLDAVRGVTVTAGWKRFMLKRKSGPLGPLSSKRRNRKENLSGKAMQDEALANAKTHGLKKSKSLEEG
jgi:hypothetical protein